MGIAMKMEVAQYKSQEDHHKLALTRMEIDLKLLRADNARLRGNEDEGSLRRPGRRGQRGNGLARSFSAGFPASNVRDAPRENFLRICLGSASSAFGSFRREQFRRLVVNEELREASED